MENIFPLQKEKQKGVSTRNTIYLSNGISPVSKKVCRTDACYDMNENIMASERNQSHMIPFM